MSERIEFNAKRSTCGCAACRAACEVVPGYLIPADLTRMAGALGYGTDTTRFAVDHLLASPGATVGRYDPLRGQIVQWRIRTLVPARTATGACHFLVNGECGVHAVSPFGCAFFDVCATNFQTAHELSAQGLLAIQADADVNGPYRMAWAELDRRGKRAPDPSTGRAKLLARLKVIEANDGKGNLIDVTA